MLPSFDDRFPPAFQLKFRHPDVFLKFQVPLLLFLSVFPMKVRSVSSIVSRLLSYLASLRTNFEHTIYLMFLYHSIYINIEHIITVITGHIITASSEISPRYIQTATASPNSM